MSAAHFIAVHPVVYADIWLKISNVNLKVVLEEKSPELFGLILWEAQMHNMPLQSVR